MRIHARTGKIISDSRIDYCLPVVLIPGSIIPFLLSLRLVSGPLALSTLIAPTPPPQCCQMVWSCLHPVATLDPHPHG